MTLENALHRLKLSQRRLEPGHVWLVGAGPGDPGQLTLDALSALDQAEAVVYDALVSPDVVAVAAQAELFFAGKRGGRPSMKQDDITALLVKLAREGRKVVRLKGGDPYIFGRGGEEALALVNEGIPFRVVPGITAALGALAATGIPSTMRGINKAITLATGHAADLAEEDLDWAALAATGQPIAVYMGLTALPAIRRRLLDGGLAHDTPAAVIEAATTPDERVLVTTLGELAERAAGEKMASPALVVVGGIVAMRARLKGGA